MATRSVKKWFRMGLEVLGAVTLLAIVVLGISVM